MNSEWAEQPQPRASLGTPGAQLKAQREAMGWSVEHVADQLKLAPRQVVALEEGDAEALPNLAVVRGFIRAYAKVVKLDAAPLVAMIEVNPGPGAAGHGVQASPVRREISATFSESRFPTLTQRTTKPGGWIAGIAVLLVAAAVGAYQMGYISPAMLMTHPGKAPASASASAAASAAPDASAMAPIETVPAVPGQQSAPMQSPSVPLISVPPPVGAPADSAAATPAAAAATPATAAVTGNALVLTVRADSWVEIRRPGAAPLISRVVTAGSTETFNITEPALLVVGKPANVDATLRGAPLELKAAPGTTISRTNIK